MFLKGVNAPLQLDAGRRIDLELAADLERAACGQLAKASSAGRNQLRDFLHDWVPERPPPLAAPGLSLHGRARAIDFQVHQGNKVIAGADTSDIDTIWIGQGWGRKLEGKITCYNSW